MLVCLVLPGLLTLVVCLGCVASALWDGTCLPPLAVHSSARTGVGLGVCCKVHWVLPAPSGCEHLVGAAACRAWSDGLHCS